MFFNVKIGRWIIIRTLDEVWLDVIKAAKVRFCQGNDMNDKGHFILWEYF